MRLSIEQFRASYYRFMIGAAAGIVLAVMMVGTWVQEYEAQSRIIHTKGAFTWRFEDPAGDILHPAVVNDQAATLATPPPPAVRTATPAVSARPSSARPSRPRPTTTTTVAVRTAGESACPDGNWRPAC